MPGGCGLKINERKSSVLKYNCGEGRLDEVGGIRVANTIRYPGVDLGDSRLCFREYQKGKVRQTSRKNVKYNFFSNCEIMQ